MSILERLERVASVGGRNDSGSRANAGMWRRMHPETAPYRLWSRRTEASGKRPGTAWKHRRNEARLRIWYLTSGGSGRAATEFAWLSPLITHGKFDFEVWLHKQEIGKQVSGLKGKLSMNFRFPVSSSL